MSKMSVPCDALLSRISARFIFFCFMPLVVPSALQGATLIHNYYGDLTPHERQLLKDNEQAHLGKAISDLQSGKPHRLKYAEADFKYILSIWPNHPKSLQGIAEVYRKMGTPSLVEPLFERALRVFPEVAETYALYGIYLYRQKDFKRSINMLKEAVRLNPSSSQNHYLLGLSYYAAGLYKEAQEHAEKAYALNYPLPGLRDMLEKKGYRVNLPDNNKNSR